MITSDRTACRAIHSFLEEHTIHQPLRIDLNFTGCCDTSLCLCVDNIRENDLISESEGITFVISPKVYELTGDITVSYADEPGRKGFVITSVRPLGEWEGFGVCKIKL